MEEDGYQLAISTLNPFAFTVIIKFEKRSRDFVFEVVKVNGYALKFASMEHQNDAEIVRTAVKSQPNLFAVAGPSLKSDREFILSILHNSAILAYMDPEFSRDKEFMLKCLKKCKDSLKYASKLLTSDRKFMLEAVKISDQAYRRIDKSLKEDLEIYYWAIYTGEKYIKISNDVVYNKYGHFCNQCFLNNHINYLKYGNKIKYKTILSDIQINYLYLQ